MTDDIERLLPDSIGKLTAGGTAPPGLAGRVLARERRRRIRMRTAMVSGTAAVVVVAVLAATAAAGGTARTAGAVRAQTAAYVLHRAQNALAGARQAGLIQQTQFSGDGAALFIAGPGHCDGEYCLGIADLAPGGEIWTYRDRLREEGFANTGKLEFDSSATITSSGKGSTATGEAISYQNRTWWRDSSQPVRPAYPSNCKQGDLPPPDGSTVDWPAAVKAALACGGYRAVGHQRIGRVNAIKLVSAHPQPAQTLWINPSSYLPIRVFWSYNYRTGPEKDTMTGTFHWLQPTAANLASLSVHVPAGFRQTRPQGLAVPGLALIFRNPAQPAVPARGSHATTPATH